MIEFKGCLTGCANKHFIKRLMNSGILLMEFMLLLSLPFWVYFGYSIDCMFETIILVIVMSLLMPILLHICVTKKEKQRMNLKKVKIHNGIVMAFNEKSKTQNKLSCVKKVLDYGDFYDIVFSRAFFASIYVCQKDLISKGTIDDFEELFKDKIVRKQSGEKNNQTNY